ncbi:nucleolar pre-ribosomal-associated protein 1 [Trichonephila clavipes]|nr:nucleolar pre-ribosomal-associated protein 1 [Trichonephila clavipes]
MPFSELIELDSHLASKVYDMRFILPLFAHLLSPGTLVYCTQFIQSKVLMLIFISLSSLEAPVRALGFYCLALFYNHLEIAPFKEKIIWLCLLDFLRNAIESSNPKIPNIISLYLARVSDIFSKPDHQMYRFLYAFITRKPLLDIRQVPDFYNLFKGTHVEIMNIFKKDFLCLDNEHIFRDDQGYNLEIMDKILTTARDLELEVNEDNGT